MKKYGIKRTKSDIAMDTICVIFLTILFIITFYPFWYVFIASINDPMDTMKGGLSLLPRVLNFSAYGVIMKDKENICLYNVFWRRNNSDIYGI